MRLRTRRRCKLMSNQQRLGVAIPELGRQVRLNLRSTQEERLPLYRCAGSEGIRTRSHCPHSIPLEDRRGRAPSPCPIEFDLRLARSDNKERTVGAQGVKTPSESPN